MAIVCRDHDLLFIEEPRTGTTSVRQVLMQLGGVELPCYRHVPLTYLVQHKHIRRPESYYKFVTVRNPWDSIVSLYIKRRTALARIAGGLAEPDWWVMEKRPYVQQEIEIASECDFPTFVERCIPNRPKGEQMRAGVDFVMRFEYLQQDFRQVLDHVGVDQSVSLPRLNVTNEAFKLLQLAEYREHYHRYYDVRSRDIVYEAYRPVIERFGYAFGYELDGEPQVNTSQHESGTGNEGSSVIENAVW